MQDFVWCSSSVTVAPPLNGFQGSKEVKLTDCAVSFQLHPPEAKALKLMHRLACDPGVVAIMNKVS